MTPAQGREKPREPGEAPRRAVRPTVPLGTGESVLITMAVMLTIMAVGGLLGGGFFSFPELFVRKVPPRPPVHEPLPDLCSVFAGASPSGLTVSPVADSREVDRNDVKCRLEVRDPSRSTHPSVRLNALRPDSVHMSLAGGDELKAARRYYRDEVSEPLQGRVLTRPVQGLGDEAKIASSADDTETEVELIVRSGVLQVSVAYREAAYGRDVRLTSAPESERIVRTLAAELLERIPPD